MIMEDNIVIEKTWQDYDFFEIRITGISNIITASAETYTTDKSIDKLTNLIKAFIDGYADGVNGCSKNYLWENGEKGDQSTACISLEFYRKDNFGHIQIEIYLELDDGGKFSKHNCCFYVETELGLLEAFGRKLEKLKEQQTGAKIILNYFAAN